MLDPTLGLEGRWLMRSGIKAQSALKLQQRRAASQRKGEKLREELCLQSGSETAGSKTAKTLRSKKKKISVSFIFRVFRVFISSLILIQFVFVFSCSSNAII